MNGDHLIVLFGVLMVVVGALMLGPRKQMEVESRPVGLRMCLATAPWHSPLALHTDFSG